MIEYIGAIILALIAAFFWGKGKGVASEQIKDLKRYEQDRKKIDAVTIDDDMHVLRDSMRERGKQGSNL